jgi:hypothetical protein
LNCFFSALLDLWGAFAAQARVGDFVDTEVDE